MSLKCRLSDRLYGKELKQCRRALKLEVSHLLYSRCDQRDGWR